MDYENSGNGAAELGSAAQLESQGYRRQHSVLVVENENSNYGAIELLNIEVQSAEHRHQNDSTEESNPSADIATDDVRVDDQYITKEIKALKDSFGETAFKIARDVSCSI